MSEHMTALKQRFSKVKPDSRIDLVNLYAIAVSALFAITAWLFVGHWWFDTMRMLTSPTLVTSFVLMALSITVIVISIWANLILKEVR